MLPDGKILFSGECDLPFRFRICGIENLIKIFTSTSELLGNLDNNIKKNSLSHAYFVQSDILQCFFF